MFKNDRNKKQIDYLKKIKKPAAGYVFNRTIIRSHPMETDIGMQQLFHGNSG